jgi:YD repeat-containing protein
MRNMVNHFLVQGHADKRYRKSAVCSGHASTNGGLTTQMYDAASNVTSIVDPDGNRTSYSFDAVYNLVQETDPLNHSSSYAYDADNQLTSSTDKLGNVISYGYDSVGDLTGETWKTGLTTTNLQTFAYDAAGNQTLAADYHGAYTMAYDALWKCSSKTGPLPSSLLYVGTP